MDHFEDLVPAKPDNESPDDFEHLGLDSAPLPETKQRTSDYLARSFGEDTHERQTEKIDTSEKRDFPTVPQAGDNLLDQPLVPHKMDSNLLEFTKPFDDLKTTDAKMDAYLRDLPQPKQQFNATSLGSFLDNERGFLQDVHQEKGSAEMLEKYSDSEPESDDFKLSKQDDSKKSTELIADIHVRETFKDIPETQPELPRKDYAAPVAPKPEIPKPVQKEEPKVEPAKEAAPLPAEIKESVKQEKKPEPVPAPEKKHEPPVVSAQRPEAPAPQKVEVCVKKPSSSQKITEAEALFCKMGLMESLIYWRDPKKSGPAFGGVLLVLLALTYFSLISVVAYLSLITLTATIAFRIYKNIIHAVQKTGDGHPFKEYLEFDLALPQDKVKEVSEVAVAHFNAAVSELRRLFLVEDLVDSIKFAVFLWVLTYVGSWFNGMTVVILAWVALFTFPKVYETNKTTIDANLDIVRTKLADITAKVKAAIPIGKKSEEKKE
ncbi:uncharacterized protein LOC143205247 isoform X2 [Rhynchophorus ferrugineus]|uniref:uncharacterized protein LOC143205247 isoform X2 n=1 Tax=Rhynchophorus ferrugineus TaxID=354439 RepID=UPI003FCCCF78